jgi:DNA repair protein RadC
MVAVLHSWCVCADARGCRPIPRSDRHRRGAALSWHRERLRERFRGVGADALCNYELLEMVLFRALPRRDVKPLAKSLIGTFGSFAEAVHAPEARLREIHGLGDAAFTEIKLIAAASSRVAKGQLKQRAMLSSWGNVIEYCRTAMAFADKEQFRILFLDKRNQLIADELQQVGTVVPYAGLSTRGGEARPRTIRHRNHHGAQRSHSISHVYVWSRLIPQLE